jgi:mono/diheme cytochrome c family protein
MRAKLTTTTLILLTALVGCRGNRTEEPPVHLNPNMDKQERYLAQEHNPHFEDGRAMRPQVPGTVARGQLRDDDHLHKGLVHGTAAMTLPLKLDEELLARGRKRYDIYCTPCHGGAGMGDGIVIKRGMLPPPSFHDKRMLELPLGEYYKAVTEGVRNMPSYAAQVPVRDRWAIIAYIRALQAARRAKLKDVPADVSTSKGWSK